MKKNETTKNNVFEKSKDKVVQSSNIFLGQQCFGYQGYGHFRSECPTYLRLKGKIMVVSLNDDEGANHKSIVVDKNVIVDENPYDGKLSGNADLQEE